MRTNRGAGNFRSSASEVILPLMAVAVLSSGCGSEPGEAAATQRTDSRSSAAPPEQKADVIAPYERCAAIDLSPMKLVRIDASQMRLFVAAATMTSDQIVDRARRLESCFLSTAWNGKWSLSVFSNAGLAGYKDEPRLAPALADGRWATAYTAEFDAANHELVMQPASAASRKVAVPRFDAR